MTLVGTCLLAWLKGGAAEKAGAVVYASCWFGFDLVFAAGRALGFQHWENFTVLLNLGSDLIVAVGLLIIALRYMSLWLGVAMWAQSLCFVMHALVLDGEPTGQRVYLVLTNSLSFAVLACLLVGTLMSWRKRMRVRRREPIQQLGSELAALG